MHACTHVVLAQAKARLHVYIHIAPHVHLGSIVGANPVIQVAIGNSDPFWETFSYTVVLV